MIQKVNSTTINLLFSKASKLIFKVPRYQREYTWGKSNWENLFDDIAESDHGYFLGSIIVIDKGYDPNSEHTEWELIDGQQRLTTLSLLLAAVYSQLEKNRAEAECDEEDVEEALKDLEQSLIAKSGTRVVPQVQGQNFNDYRYVMSEYVSGKIKQQRPNRAGNRRICKAFGYFESRLEGLIESSGDGDHANAYAALDDFKEKVLNAVLVYIQVTTTAEAYTLFETLNNRGKALSALDLIKNTLLANIENATGEELDAYFEEWQRLLSLLGEDYKTQERFFRQAYNAFRREANAPFATESSRYPLGSVATRSNLLSIYEKQIKRDALGTLEWLLANAEEYSKITLVNTDGLNQPLEDSLRALSRIQGAPSYVLVLRLMRQSEKLKISEQHLVDINGLLVKFFVRRNLTDTPPTRDLTRLFISIIEGIEDGKLTGDALCSYIKERLVSISADDARFLEMLKGPIYDSNSDATRFILASLAEPSVTKEMAGLWDKNTSGTYVWTIEHVLPQGKNIPDDWVKMIADGDRNLASEIQKAHVHELGNLTLTGYNQSLSNLSFEKKKNRKDKAGNNVGYLNGLNINADIAERDEWTQEAIVQRTEKLAAEVVELFTF